MESKQRADLLQGEWVCVQSGSWGGVRAVAGWTQQDPAPGTESLANRRNRAGRVQA